jgi:hypothetical protein
MYEYWVDASKYGNDNVTSSWIHVGYSMHYGNTGCGVFKVGILNSKKFWLKIICSQMKLPSFDNWSNGELSKSDIILENKVISIQLHD